MNKKFKHKIICGDCIKEMEKFSNEYFDLIIADPPYWKVIGEKWDYQWRTEEDYVEWSKKWINEAYRVLRYGGSFYLFGYFRILVLLIPYLQNLGFEFRQQIIINKGIKAVAGRATKKYKMFPNVTESVLFFVKDNIRYSRSLLKNRQKELGLSSKKINEALGVKSNGGGMWSIYTGKNICEQFPTEQLWNKLQDVLKFKFPYNKIAQTYHTKMGITDVWSDIDFYSEKRIHPTQKPIKLIDRLINASSNKGDHILDPFGGSGSTLISAYKNQRNVIIIEIDSNYIEKIKQRIGKETNLLS
ncbi:MAG: DNA-methyltransferase [Candidatus Avelusimicrobium sp.]|uniref:DNA-methyltransferase n=1 Tax=Candidatus Avelusimicrobium sp. TaxID=3048833 RepID=UPI003F02D1E6